MFPFWLKKKKNQTCFQKNNKQSLYQCCPASSWRWSFSQMTCVINLWNNAEDIGNSKKKHYNGRKFYGKPLHIYWVNNK